MDQWQVPSDMASGEPLDRELTKLITVIIAIELHVYACLQKGVIV